MKRISKSIVFVIVLLCLSIAPIFSIINVCLSGQYSINGNTVTNLNSASNSSLTALDSVPQIYLEAKKVDSNGVAQVEEFGYKVGFYIKATSSVSNVKVSWRTRDMTAIAKEGDYASKDTTYTLNGTSSPLLYVNIYNQGVATRVDRKLARLQVNNDLTSEDSITRNFFIEITELNCDESVATIDNTRKQLVASAGSEYTFSVTKIFDEKNSNNYMSYFSSYEFIKDSVYASYTPRNQKIKNAIYIDKSPNIQDGKKYYSDAVYPSTTVFNEFINRGYADLYATIMADTYEDKTIGSSDNIRVSIVYADNKEYICQYDIEYGGWSSEHTYDMLQMQTSSRYTTNPGKVLVGDTISRHYYDGRYYYYYKEEYWEVKDPNRRIQVEFWDYEDYNGRYFYDVKVNTIIADTKAPEVTGYYLQQEPLKQGDKLGLTVRFTEPVQLIGNKRKPIISARINNNSNYYADFEYVAGSGTDTLYFEWTPTDKNIDITSFTLCDFLNASSIADYSISANVVQNPQIFRSDDTDSFRGDSSKFTYYEPEIMFDDKAQTWTDGFMNHNQLSKPNLDKTINYKVDLRTPNIHTDVKASDMASKYVEVPIIIESLKSDGKIYYSWTNSTLTPDKYENEVTNFGDIYTIRATDMNGRYYLHIKAVSTYGKKQILMVGPFKFDGEPPSINTEVTGDLTSRTFALNIVDGAETADWSSGVAEVTLTVAKDIEGKDIAKTYSYNGNGAKTFTKNVTVSATDLGLGENEYGIFYIFVTAYDNIGNKAQTEIETYKFDRRTFFDVKFESAKSEDVDKVLDISTDDYKVIDITEDVLLHFSSSDTTGALTDLIVKNANNEMVEVYTYSFTPTVKDISIKNDFTPGFYTISFMTTESGTKKYSPEFVFYFTKGKSDEGLYYHNKVANGILLTNSVYQLNSDLPYYYMDKNGNIQTLSYSGDSTKPATFSSMYEAIMYLKFMEYQDLYPIKITNEQAILLNGRSSPNFLKANGETMVAQANQIWIRYKTTSFEKDPTTSQWAYYYYQGDDLKIRQEYLSMNILDSIGIVAERLVKSNGKKVILVGEGKVNKYNEPYLDKEQIHSSYVSVNQTKCGIKFNKAIFYDGDTRIYNSTITENGSEYSIATNLEIESRGYNRLFYKGQNNTTYTEIDLNKYTNLSQVITASGVYDLLELDTNGVREYSVYIDRDVPTLTAYVSDAEGNKTIEFNKSSQGITYTTKSFAFGPFSEIEKDELATVSVWKYMTNKTGELLKVYLRSDLQENSYALENGDYHIEVSDRSGNSYSFVLRVNSQDFICDTIEIKDEYIMVTCNREENQIQAYEICLNGELLTSKYSQRQKFEQSGAYSIYIRDIYDNEYKWEINFERSYPTVDWQYYDDTLGDYVKYDDGVSKKMKVTRVDNTTFRIVTSAMLRFKYDSLYKYEFISNTNYNENNITHLVSINDLRGFTLKVGYAKFNETMVTYICEVDDSAPNISVKNDIEVFNYNEIDYFNEQLESGEVGDILKYNSISYSKRSVLNSYLSNGDTVNSRILKLSATDNYGVALIKVYLDDKLLIEETQNFANIVLSRYGHYRIEAYDEYDNKSEFTFTNTIQENLKYFVDGAEYDASLSTLSYFDESGNFSKIEYGREFVELLFKDNGILSLKVIGNDNTIYSTLEIQNGKIYYLTYKIGEGKVILTERSLAIFDISQSDMVAGDWYLIMNKNRYGKDIYAKFDNENNISIKVENSSNQNATIEGRVKIGSVEPFYFRTELSTIKSDVTIKNVLGEKIETNQNESQIKINKEFYIDSDNLSDKIKSIKVYYSTGGVFDKKDCIWSYDKGAFEPRRNFTDNWLYLIEIENVYGNITKYYILKSENFMATITAELADGKKFNYSEKYTNTVFSNKNVYIYASSENVTYDIKRGDESYSGAVKSVANGVTTIKISEAGEFVITLTDEYGNIYTATFEILAQDLAFDDSLIEGYNGNELKADYTKEHLSINSEKVAQNNIYYVSVIFNDNETVLYDNISENKVAMGIMEQCIGNSGDGAYRIIFRDKYGNMMPEKVIHYKKSTTLVLSRKIRSSVVEQSYDIQEAIDYGFWSNDSLIFNTNSELYELKINGEKVDCPLTLSFGSGADEGNLDYDIVYQDEYGNLYSFKSYLFRQKLELLIPSGIKTIEENGVLVTRSNIFFTIPDNATCTYTLNGVEKDYRSNTILRQDGSYRFTIRDRAGNVSALNIKKDTVVEFNMTEVMTSTKVINGGIVCSNSVAFTALKGDSAYIKYVFRDGELLDDFADNKFTGSGKWEIIVADNIGNESYFAFQIITHKLKSFDYTVPYGYKITDIQYDSGNGVQESYMDFVEGNGTSIKLTDNGKYSVVMTSEITGMSASFYITINNAKPQISLVGCEENETTLNDITISGCKVGDKIEIYRDNKLYKTVEILTEQDDAPTITEGGNYTIVVTNEAGVESSVSFVKKYIPNTPGNVLIVVLIIVVAMVVFIGLVYRQRSKVDE